MNVVQECAASEKGAVDTGSTVNSNAGPAQ
jgi:hypothetical protein